jgi:hypothetical protein
VTPAEVDVMVDAPQAIALELGLRFLLDYLRGDSYFKLGPADPPDLNRLRATAQLSLFQRLRDCADEARRFIEELQAEFLDPRASSSAESPVTGPGRHSPGGSPGD